MTAERPLRRLARRVTERAGLIGTYYRWLEQRAVREAADDVDDGRPMPLAELSRLAAEHFDVAEMIPGRSDAPVQAIAVLRARL